MSKISDEWVRDIELKHLLIQSVHCCFVDRCSFQDGHSSLFGAVCHNRCSSFRAILVIQAGFLKRVARSLMLLGRRDPIDERGRVSGGKLERAS